MFRAKARQEEDYKLNVYKDSRGILTVGIGHKVLPSDKLSLGQIITPARAEAFFIADLAMAFEAAKKQARECSKYNADFICHLALVNYQLGTAWTYKFYNTWEYLKTGKWSQAVRNLGVSDWAKQTPDRVVAFQEAIKRNYA